MPSLILALNAENFGTEVLAAPGPVLVDFSAEWCGPCRMLRPVLDELAEEYQGRIKIGQVNIDEFPALAAQYGVHSFPTLTLFKDSQVLDQVVGLRSKRDLKASLDKVTAQLCR